MIPALLDYAQDRGRADRPGYATKSARWLIQLSADGTRVLGALSLVTDKRPREFHRVPNLTQGESITLGAREGAAAQFLLAPLSDLAGLAKDEGDPKVEAGRRTALRMLAECGEPRLAAAARTLDDPGERARLLEILSRQTPNPKPEDNATLDLGGDLPLEWDTWAEWWETFRVGLVKPRKGARQMASFASGDPVDVAMTHGVLTSLAAYGANTAGAVFLPFDKPAFGSYGLSQGENAAMSAEETATYRATLDHILKEQGVRLAGARVAYWYVGPAEVRGAIVEDLDPMQAALNGRRDRIEDETSPTDAESIVRTQLERPKTGNKAARLDDMKYCVLAISGAGGRVMVRDFIQGNGKDLDASVQRWFEDLSLHNWFGEPGGDPKLEAVITAPLAPQGRKQDYGDWVQPAGAWRQALWRAAIQGTDENDGAESRCRTPIPRIAVQRALLAHTRSVVKGELTSDDSSVRGPARWRARLRLALVKAYLIRHPYEPVNMTPDLDPDQPAPYQCGRLLAVYDSLQRAALGSVGAGVVQRYYGGALTHPAGVFGQLSRLAQTHLAKKRWLPGVYGPLLEEIHGRIGTAFPGPMRVDDQALFALGYWHQVPKTRERVKAHFEKIKAEGKDIDTDTEDAIEDL